MAGFPLYSSPSNMFDKPTLFFPRKREGPFSDGEKWYIIKNHDNLLHSKTKEALECRIFPEKLIEFIQKSPSCYHAVENIAGILGGDGFTELREGEKWTLRPGGRYFVRRSLSAILAFKLPAGALRGFQIAASHCDSPTFKIKENMDIVVDRGLYPAERGKIRRHALRALGSTAPCPWPARSWCGRGDRLVSKLVNIDRGPADDPRTWPST